jgi:hypothetical protein
MGWIADKQHEGDERLRQAVTPAVPPGETLVGVVLANQQKALSAKLYAVGVTERHLVLQPVGRSMQPSAPAIVLAQHDVEVGNIFNEGAGLGGLGQKGQEIRFTARGEKYKLMVLGGNLVENALASDGHLSGLGALAEFLRSARR